MCSLLKVWKKQVRTSTLGRMMRQYWKVFYNEERRHFGHRAERLCFLKRLIKRKLPKRIIPSKVWFYGYGIEKHEIFNPFNFIDDEKYLEILIVWKERKMKKYIDENPRLLIKGYRHEKISGNKKPIRV